MWQKPYRLAKSANSWELYCGPLSLMSSSGIPCQAKMEERDLMILCDVVLVSFTTSGYRKK